MDAWINKSGAKNRNGIKDDQSNREYCAGKERIDEGHQIESGKHHG